MSPVIEKISDFYRDSAQHLSVKPNILLVFTPIVPDMLSALAA